MALDVKLDVQHPSAGLTVDRAQADLYTKWKLVRVHSVAGLQDGSANQSSTILSRALHGTGIDPMWTLAPGEAGQNGAFSQHYSVLPIMSSDQAVYVGVTYENTLPQNVSNIPWIMDDDMQVVIETCDLHPKDKSPMNISYAPPASKQGDKVVANVNPYVSGSSSADPATNAEQFPAHFKYRRPLRRVVLSGVTTTAQIANIRNAFICTNDGAFLSYPTGYWLFDGSHSQGVLYGNIVKCSFGIISRINEDWRAWDILYSPALGRRVTVDPADSAALQKKPYTYDFQTKNGIGVAGLYPLTSFSSLFQNIVGGR